MNPGNGLMIKLKKTTSTTTENTVLYRTTIFKKYT